MNATVYTNSARKIEVVVPEAYTGACEDVPTRRWFKNPGVWRYSRTPWVARSLLAALRKVGPVTVEPDVEQLAAIARPVQETVSDRNDGPIERHPRSVRVPWRHQYRLSGMISRNHAVYGAHDMGTGKSKSLLDAILETWPPGTFFPVLIGCPVSVVEVWETELKKNVRDLSNVYVSTGGAPKKKSIAERVSMARLVYESAKASGGLAIVVSNFEAFSNTGSAFLEWASLVGWSMVAIDEAHRLSTPGSNTTRAFTDKIGPRARRRVCLSGTPMRNSPLDLYAQCKFLDPGIFGTNERQFLERYAILDFFGNVVGIQNESELYEKFSLVADFVDKRSVIDLPPVVTTTRRFALSPEIRKIYDELESKLTVEIPEKGSVTSVNGMVNLLRLQQLTSGFLPVENPEEVVKVERLDSGKSDVLAEILSELPEREPVTVFCRFRPDLEEVRAVAEAAGRKYFELSGRIKQTKEWQEDDSGSVLGIQIRSGGVGIDLTRSAYSVFLSVGFSLSDYEQATARIDRPGQTRPTTLIRIIANGTADEATFGSIDKKGNVVEDVYEYLREKRKGAAT